MAQQSGREARVVHCSGCGLIMGKDCPGDLAACPNCQRVLRLAAIRLDDGIEVTEFIAVEALKKRFVDLYVSEGMLRFLLTGRTSRTDVWEPLLVDLEEERLKAFCRQFGWVMAAVYRDPGPRAQAEQRPFSRLAADLTEGIANTILITDAERVTRKDLHSLCQLARTHKALLLSIAPHPDDPNLRLEDVEHDSVGDANADNPGLETIWTPEVTAAVHRVMATVGWNWPHYAPDVAARAMVPRAFRVWREADPSCLDRGWRNVMRSFIIARMRRSGDVARVDPPSLHTCQLCRRRFLDAALPIRLVERVTTTTTYCGDCLERAFFYDHEGAGAAGPAELDSAADRDAATALLRGIQPQRIRAFIEAVLAGRAEDDRSRERSSPSDRWLTAARSAQLLALGEIEITARYILAADGHVVRTIGTALLDNWLAASSLPHRREVRYPADPEINPNGTMRADFGVGAVLIEFLGLRGIDEYGKKIEHRVELAKRTGVEIIAIYAEDLLVTDVLDRKAATLLATYRLQDNVPLD